MSIVAKSEFPAKKKLRDGMIKSRKTRTGDLIIAGICFLLMLLCLLPMVHVLASSLSSADALVRNDVFIWPKGWNIEAYKTVLTTEKYVRSLGWTAILTVICTLLSISLTIMAAYPLTYTNLKGGRFINFIILFTMYFSAGTIPYYLLLSRLGMLNTPYALIFPNCIGVFNVIIMRSFFFGVPDSLKEAAEIDGAGPIRVLIRVYLPLSLPVIATLSLFYAVGRCRPLERFLRCADVPQELRFRKILAHPAAPVQRDQEFHPDHGTGGAGRLLRQRRFQDHPDGDCYVRHRADPAGISLAAAVLRCRCHDRCRKRVIL